MIQFSVVVTISLTICLNGCFSAGNPGQQDGSIVANKSIDSKNAQNTQDVQVPEVIKVPDPSEAVEQAPEEFVVRFDTTKGEFLMNIHREWSPNGADRFYNMVKVGYFRDTCIFRAVEGFMFQFGVHGDPEVSAAWGEATIKDDPKSSHSNLPGTITFAKSGAPHSRSVQLFINLGDNGRLDRDGFTPFGEVAEGGMEVVKQINTEYGDTAQLQGPLAKRGNEWIRKEYPNLDFIKSITLVVDESADGGDKKDGAGTAGGDKTGGAKTGDGGGS